MREIPSEINMENSEPERYQEHPQLQSAIDGYLQEKENHYKKLYPDSYKLMLESERKMIRDNREKGYLSNWQPGENVLVCITENIEKSLTIESGAIDLGSQLSHSFSPDVIEARKNGLIVSMNEGKTFSTKEVDCKEDEFKIFSFGQGGCINVVLAGKEEDGNILVSVLHFSPDISSKLIDALAQERSKYSNIKETRAVSFTESDEKKEVLNTLSVAIELFPSPKYEKGETDKMESIDASRDILEITVNKKTKQVTVQMKGQAFNWQM